MPDGLTLEQLRAAPAPAKRGGLTLEQLRAAPAPTAAPRRFFAGVSTDIPEGASPAQPGPAFKPPELETQKTERQRRYEEERAVADATIERAIAPVRGVVQPVADVIRRQQPGGDLFDVPTRKVVDEAVSAGLRSGAAAVFSPATFGTSVVPGGNEAMQLAMKPVEAAGRYVTEKTGSKAAGAATEIALPLLVGGAAARVAKGLRGASAEPFTRGVDERFNPPERGVRVTPEEAARIVRERGAPPAEAPVRPAEAVPETRIPAPQASASAQPEPLPFAESPEEINAKKWYHGTGTRGMTAEALDPSRTDAGSLFGQGVYLTDNPSVAEGYAKARSKSSGTPTVYESQIEVRNPLRAEAPATPEIRAVIERAAKDLRENGYDVGTEEALKQPNVTTERLIQEFRQDVRQAVLDREIDVDSAWAQMDRVTQGLRELGYDAVTHEGGKRVGAKQGGPRHQVVIPLPDETGTRLQPVIRSFSEKAPAPRAEEVPPAPATTAPTEAAAPPAGGAGQAPAPRMIGRPLSREAGILGVPAPKPLPPEIPSGTPAEMGAIGGVKEHIRFGEEPTPKVIERVKSAAELTEAKGVRKEAPLRHAEKFITGTESETGPTAQAKFAQGSSSTAARNLVEHGVLDEKTTAPVNAALEAVVKSGRRLSDVSAYATAKRFVTDYEPNKLAAHSSDPAIEAAKLAQDRQTIDFYEKNHPVVVKAAETIAETNRLLRSNLAEADRWTPQRLAEMEARNKFPIEIKRDFGDASEGSRQPIGRGAPMTGPRIIARTGVGGAGELPTRDPLIGIEDSARRWIAAADQARVKHSFLDMVRADPQRAAALVEELTPAQVKQLVPDFDAIAQRVNPGADPASFPATFDAYDAAYAKGVIPFEEGGATKFLRVKKPALAEAIAGGDFGKMEQALRDTPIIGHGLKAAEAITSVQRAGITEMSPSFPVKNAIRDAILYPLQASKYANDFKVGVNYAKGMLAALRTEAARIPKIGDVIGEPKIADTARRARLQTFSQTDTLESAPKSIERMDKGLARYYLDHPLRAPKAIARTGFEWWKHLNSLIEKGPRFAGLLNELDAIGKKPGDVLTRDDIVRLGNAGQEATVNFRLGGDVTKAANRYLFNFVNPAIQGAEQLRQSAWGNKATFARRVMTYYVAPAAGAYFWWQSSPERKKAWDRMTPWRRAQVNIPIEHADGSVTPLSLPLPQEAGMFYTGTIAALDAAHREHGIALDTLKEAISRANPVDAPLHPSAIQPIAEVKQGFADFSGRSINPPSMEGGERIDPSKVRQPYNGPVPEAVSKFLHWITGGRSTLTTAEVAHLMGGYGGTAGRQVASLTPEQGESSDIPVVGPLFPRMKESRFVDEYRDLRKTFEGQGNLASALKKTDRAAALALRLPEGLARGVADVDRRLKALDQWYDRAPESDRAMIADLRDRQARRGLTLLRRASPAQRLGRAAK